MRSNYDDYDESRSKNADSEDQNEHSTDTVWFIKTIGEFESMTNVTDVYGHKVISGQKYMLGHFLEKVNDNTTSNKYTLIENKTTIFFMRVLSILL